MRLENLWVTRDTYIYIYLCVCVVEKGFLSFMDEGEMFMKSVSNEGTSVF